MNTTTDFVVDRKVPILAGGTRVLIGDELTIRFDGPTAQMVELLDELTISMQEVRGRLLRELATDGDV